MNLQSLLLKYSYAWIVHTFVNITTQNVLANIPETVNNSIQLDFSHFISKYFAQSDSYLVNTTQIHIEIFLWNFFKHCLACALCKIKCLTCILDTNTNPYWTRRGVLGEVLGVRTNPLFWLAFYLNQLYVLIHSSKSKFVPGNSRNNLM